MRVSLVLCFLFSVTFIGFSDAKDGGNACTLGTACRPWEDDKPCTSGQRMDLRYGVRRSVSGSMLAFGFCPIVDELQAFNLTRVGSVLSGLEAGDNATLSVYGQGAASNPTKDFSNAALFAEKSDKCGPSQVAVANFLLLRLPMTRGRYKYTHNVSYPNRAGFVPTCDGRDRCPYVAKSICIGPVGQRSCASCYSEDSLASVQTTIWASYYGTDRVGKMFKSGDFDLQLFHKFTVGSLETVVSAFEG